MFSLTPGRAHSNSHTGRARRIAIAASIVTATAGAFMIGLPVSAGIVPTVSLATSGDYSVLAATTVTNTNPSVIGQSVGLSPGSAIVGFPPGIVLPPATIQAANAVTAQAQIDLTTAYVDAAARPIEFTQTNPDLVGQTLAPGVYEATAHGPLALSGQLVLDGQGNPNAVFIFQTGSTLITSTGSTIALINGASECNIFWQVGSSATLGSGSLFVGNILALTSVTVESSVVVHGRALARNGAVTLDNNVFTQPSCTPTTDTVPTATAPSAATSTTAPPAAATTTTSPAGAAPTDLPTTAVSTTGAPGNNPGPQQTGIGTDAGAADTISTSAFPSGNVALPSTGTRSTTITIALAAALLLAGLAIAGFARRRQPG